MPAIGNRQAITAKAVKARSTGGTTAPASAAKGPATGLTGRRPAKAYGWGSVWKPGAGANTAYGKNPGKYSAPGPAAPAAPGAPAPPKVMPWDSRYEQRVSGGQKTYLDTIASLDQAEKAGQQDYGLDPGFNDYQTNPNSRAAALEQSYKTANKGTMASAGLQLYSGSTSNRLGANRANYSGNRDSLAKEYRDFLAGIKDGRTKAVQDKEESDREAYWDRVEAAENTPLEPSSPPVSGPGAQAKTKHKKKTYLVGISSNQKAVAPKKKKGK